MAITPSERKAYIARMDALREEIWFWSRVNDLKREAENLRHNTDMPPGLARLYSEDLENLANEILEKA